MRAVALLALATALAGCAHVSGAKAQRGKLVAFQPDDPDAAHEKRAMVSSRGGRRLFDGRLVNDWLGVEIAIPPEFEANADFDDVQLAVRSRSAVGAVLFIPVAWNAANVHRFFQWAEANALGDPEAKARFVSDGIEHPVDLEWSRGFTRTWQLADARVTATVGPICNGRYALGFVTDEENGATALSEWRWSHHVASIAACRPLASP